jgi:hypothetical protein
MSKTCLNTLFIKNWNFFSVIRNQHFVPDILLLLIKKWLGIRSMMELRESSYYTKHAEATFKIISSHFQRLYILSFLQSYYKSLFFAISSFFPLLTKNENKSMNETKTTIARQLGKMEIMKKRLTLFSVDRYRLHWVTWDSLMGLEGISIDDSICDSI